MQHLRRSALPFGRERKIQWILESVGVFGFFPCLFLEDPGASRMCRREKFLVLASGILTM